MHGHFAEDPAAQINSVIKVFGRGKNDFGLLDIAGIQVYRAFHRRAGWLEERREFDFKLVGLSLDFRQLIRFNKPREREKCPIDEIAHFRFVIIGEIERNNVGSMIDGAEGRRQSFFDLRYELSVGDENSDEEFDRSELTDRTHTHHETTIAEGNPG